MRVGATSIILISALLAATAGGYLQWRAAHPALSTTHWVVQQGETLPALTLTAPDGRPQSLSAYRGRPLLINFWASWCGPCLDEMPRLDRVARAGNIQVLGIAMDDPARVRAFLDQHPLSYPVLLGRRQPPATSLYFGDSGNVLPFSVLVDRKGRLLDQHAGLLSADLLRQWLDQAQH